MHKLRPQRRRASTPKLDGFANGEYAVPARALAREDTCGPHTSSHYGAAVAIVRVAGISKWIASGSINPGVALAAATTTGKSKAAVVSDAAAVGSNAFAIALTTGATDTAHNVLIARQGLLPATAA